MTEKLAVDYVTGREDHPDIRDLARRAKSEMTQVADHIDWNSFAYAKLDHPDIPGGMCVHRFTAHTTRPATSRPHPDGRRSSR